VDAVLTTELDYTYGRKEHPWSQSEGRSRERKRERRRGLVPLYLRSSVTETPPLGEVLKVSLSVKEALSSEDLRTWSATVEAEKKWA